MQTVIVVICIMVFDLTVMVIALRTEEEAEKNRMMKEYIRSMERMYQLIQDKVDTMRGYRHDLAKHIRTLSAMVEQEQGEKSLNLQKYSEGLQHKYKELDESRICEDEIVNAIVSIKKQQCEAKQIPFSAEIEDTVYSGIRGTDLTAVLYNLLDNAVEANEKITDTEQRGIWLSMWRTENETWIEVKNKVEESYFPGGGEQMFETTKARKSAHGLGTKIIEKYVEKYKGSREVTFDEAEKMLSVRISLRTDEQESD